MVSPSPQDEKQKNLKYKLKEPVIRFTYHSSYVPFGWRRIRPVELFGVLQKWAVCDTRRLQTCRLADLQTLDLQTWRVSTLVVLTQNHFWNVHNLRFASRAYQNFHVSAASKRNGKMELQVSVLHSRVKVLMCGWRCDWFLHFFHFH